MAEINQLVHKTIEHKINFESHTVYSFWKNEGDRLRNTYERLGSLLMLTTTEPEIYGKVASWETMLLDWLASECKKLKEQKDAFVSNAGLEEVPAVETPSSYSENIQICYPSIWKLMKAIKEIDLQISEVENLWIAGVVDDLARHQTSNRVVNILRKFKAKIENATSPGRGREGGRFKAPQLISLIRGGLELYVEDKDIQNELNRLKETMQTQQSEKTKSNSKGSETPPVNESTGQTQKTGAA